MLGDVDTRKEETADKAFRLVVQLLAGLLAVRLAAYFARCALWRGIKFRKAAD